MIQWTGAKDGAVHIDGTITKIEEVPRRLHDVHVDRKIRVGHLAFDRSLDLAALALCGVEKEEVHSLVQGQEEWNALDMVPVEMSQENVAEDGFFAELTEKALSKRSQPAPAVQHNQCPVG